MLTPAAGPVGCSAGFGGYSVEVKPSGARSKLHLIQRFALDYLVPGESLWENLEQRKCEPTRVVRISLQQIHEQLVTAVTGFGVLFPPSPHTGGSVRASHVKIASLFRQNQVHSGYCLQGRPPISMGVRVAVEFFQL